MLYEVPGCSTFSYTIKVCRLFPVPESRCQLMEGVTDHSMDRREVDDEFILSLSSIASWTFVRMPQFLRHL